MDWTAGGGTIFLLWALAILAGFVLAGRWVMKEWLHSPNDTTASKILTDFRTRRGRISHEHKTKEK